VKKQIDTPGQAQNLDERVCAPERIEEHLREMDRPVASPSLE
jgi:hypothetical protein